MGFWFEFYPIQNPTPNSQTHLYHFGNKIEINSNTKFLSAKMKTYTTGLTLKTERTITKDDIITLCKLLNQREEYSELCEFEPEAISEGGILYKFKDSDKKWYKTVRLCVRCGETRGKWYWINENVLSEWSGNNDRIFNPKSKFDTYLKSFNGAPLFTLEELKIWEECFGQIGIRRVGKYPSKKSLISTD